MNIGDKVWTTPHSSKKPFECKQPAGNSVFLSTATKAVIVGEGKSWGNWVVELVTGDRFEVNQDQLVRQPEVGMGCSAGYGSDDYPYFVTGVAHSGKSFIMQTGDHGVNKKIWPEQDYDCTPNTEGSMYKVNLTKRGWTVEGSKKTVYVGVARFYQDPHF